jgi:hypothetical protein
MDAAREREIIRLWSRLRPLEREGRSVTAVLRQIERPWPNENFRQLEDAIDALLRLTRVRTV